MYRVDISPMAKEILEDYVILCYQDNGEECALSLLDSFDEKVEFLKNTPLIGCARLRYVPDKYRVLNFWPHLWFVFQIKEHEACVKIEYIIDDRQNYGRFLR